MQSARGHATGANIPQAMRHLATAGITPQRIATDLAVTLRTVRRWAAGTQTPNARNFERLWVWLRELRSSTVQRNYRDRDLDERTFEAFEALETDAERAEREARNAARRVEVPKPRRSAYADVDPFLLAGAKPEPALF